jgi:hypothetical protein
MLKPKTRLRLKDIYVKVKALAATPSKVCFFSLFCRKTNDPIFLKAMLYDIKQIWLRKEQQGDALKYMPRLQHLEASTSKLPPRGLGWPTSATPF